MIQLLQLCVLIRVVTFLENAGALLSVVMLYTLSLCMKVGISANAQRKMVMLYN
jgi:hypothetical protein